jgi:hypothetical protein
VLGWRNREEGHKKLLAVSVREDLKKGDKKDDTTENSSMEGNELWQKDVKKLESKGIVQHENDEILANKMISLIPSNQFINVMVVEPGNDRITEDTLVAENRD